MSQGDSPYTEHFKMTWCMIDVYIWHLVKWGDRNNTIANVVQDLGFEYQCTISGIMLMIYPIHYIHAIVMRELLLQQSGMTNVC